MKTTRKSLLATARFLGLYEQLSEHVLRRTAVVDKARALALTASDQEIQAEADAYRKEHGLSSAKKTHAWLASIEHAVGDFEREMEYRVILAKRRKSFSPSEIEAAFNAHRAEFDQARVSHILVESEARARDLMTQVKGEESFRTLALKHSLDEKSRDIGGYRGWVGRASLGPLAAKAMAAAPGTCVGTRRMGDRYGFVMVHEVKKGALDEETRTTIREALLDQWCKDLRAQETLEIQGA